MKKYITMICISAVLIVGTVKAQDGKAEFKTSENQCFVCHSEMEILPENFAEADIHMKAGLSCEGCHGGDPISDDPEASMSKSKGFVGVPAKKDIPKFCGKCHSSIEVMRVFQPRIATDQEAQYYTSVHGKKLKSGDRNVADCVSCHTAHSIFPARDPRSSVYSLNVPSTCDQCHGDRTLMKEYGLEGNEVEEYKQGVHGIALLENKDTGAPACNDCHGNHGATPPGLTSISHVCGTCHINNAEYFNSTSMAQAFEDMDYHGCEQCHGKHLIKKTNDEMAGVGDGSLCTDCHSEGDDGYLTAQAIKANLDNLVAHYDSAQTMYDQVMMKGMNEAEIGFELQEAKQNLIQSRTLVHTFDSTRVKEKTDEGLNKAKTAIQMANTEIDEYFSRRNGFAVATIAFLVLIIALYFKLKEKVSKKA